MNHSDTKNSQYSSDTHNHCASGVAASYVPISAVRDVWIWRLGLCGGSRRAAEHGSFRMWFIIGSRVYISSPACAAQRAVDSGKREELSKSDSARCLHLFVCNFLGGAAIWKEGREMLNYMWQLGNWPCFRIWILRRWRTELLVDGVMSNYHSWSALYNCTSQTFMDMSQNVTHSASDPLIVQFTKQQWLASDVFLKKKKKDKMCIQVHQHVASLRGCVIIPKMMLSCSKSGSQRLQNAKN